METEETAHELYIKGLGNCMFYDIFHDSQRMKFLELSANKGYIAAIMELSYIYCEMDDYDAEKKYILIAANKCQEFVHDVACYFKYREKNNDFVVKYCTSCIKNDNKNQEAIYFLASHYFSVGEYDLMKQYCVLHIQNGSTLIFELLNNYYTNSNSDYSFLEFYKYNNQKISNIVNKLKMNIELPKQYYPLFCQLDLMKNNKISQKVIKKQYILQKTNIWPLNYSEKYILHFMELLSLKKCIFPKDILMLIAGYLFI